MSLSSLEVIDCGVDWYTCTLQDEKFIQLAVSKAALLMMQEESAGNEKHFWEQYGYEGFRSGGLAFGTRPDGMIVRLSGPTAQQHWRSFHPLTHNTSRIDCQVTLRESGDTSKRLSLLYRSARRDHRENNRARTIALYKSSDGSATIYLGKRISDRFGRCYQKDRESGLDHYQGALRFEVEIKGRLARAVAHHLNSCSSLETQCFSIVREYFMESGIRIPNLGDHHFTNIRASRTLCDNDRTLAWLKQSVKPAIERLKESLDSATIRAALGL